MIPGTCIKNFPDSLRNNFENIDMNLGWESQKEKPQHFSLAT